MDSRGDRGRRRFRTDERGSRIAGSLFVKPNEISLEQPYIQSHIDATRAAYGLNARMKEIEMHTNPNANLDLKEQSAAR